VNGKKEAEDGNRKLVPTNSEKEMDEKIRSTSLAAAANNIALLQTSPKS